MANGILVVDDDPSTCELICEVLESAEIRSRSTCDTRHASTLIREDKFDAIFLDIRMPQPDGIALTSEVRASALNRTTPIVIITGGSDRGLLTRAFDAGATFVLFKPVDRHRLMRLLRVSEDLIQQEARQFQRVKVTCKVAVQMEQERLIGRTLDLSLNGAMVCTDKILSLGSVVKVDLELARGKPPLALTAKVVRVVGVDCMGIHFENVPIEHSRKMQEFLLPLILAVETEVKVSQHPVA
jgi:two-component system chemotaxis response regulator CheY